jgi:hypothetical protein
MALIEHVRIARRFLRSIRIDTELGDAKALEGFVCPQSTAEVLVTMALHISETGQSAFTWTGPYGSGKSSLVIALSALLNGKSKLKKQATKIFGNELTTTIWNSLPTGTFGWHILPVVGRRDNPVLVIGETMQATGLVANQPQGGWSEGNLIQAVTEIATKDSKNYGGLIIFIDEMGKFLESASQDGTDIYIFQQIAEAASRSNGRLIIVGILHQAFEEYARRVTRELRDEWTKIQGRFIDFAINTAGEEQIDLLSRAIESDYKPEFSSQLSHSIASSIYRNNQESAERLALILEHCWPLHPVVACLLGPISRRRFGQNQRSIFGFLNSAEPFGFQYFLRSAEEDNLYSPDRLWDYLRANLEPSILASPDGHRWALAAEALERCEAIGGDALHVRLLKTIAVIDLFKERSGVSASFKVLATCLPDIPTKAIKNALLQLEGWSLTIFKKFLEAHAIYAGSDFDIDQAVQSSLERFEEIDFAALKSLAGLQPVLAKRHYHDTGALRWFDINLGSIRDLTELATRYRPQPGSIGQFLLAIPTDGESEERSAEMCLEAARQSEEWATVAGLSQRAWAIVALARELIALESVRNDRPELSGDAVARREVSARLAALQSQLEAELHKAFDGAVWFRNHHEPRPYRHVELNILASELADQRFDNSPKLNNELLNRQKPSSNAIAAQNALLRRMVLHEGQPRLGIEGFPAEGGLLASILEATGLYIARSDGWQFVEPRKNDPCRLLPMWIAATDFIKTNAHRTIAVSEIYDLWRRAPFGVKDGLLPVLTVAFILSRRDGIAIYREGIFRARFDDVDIDYLVNDPTSIQLRWMNLSETARRLLSEMANVVRAIDLSNSLVHLEPIDVARGLVSIYDDLPPWTKRTTQLSNNAIRIRDLFKSAQDPNKFLFDDIPFSIVKGRALTSSDDLHRIIAGVRAGLEELIEAYPSMLRRLRDLMLAELQVPNLSLHSLAELRDRATNIRQLAGDFHLEAFVGRLTQFDETLESIEGIASLAASKPPRSWVDLDLDRAAIDIADMSQNFLRAETYARVKGRPEKRHAMAVMIGINGRPAPIHEEFDVAEADRATVDELIGKIATALDGADTKRRGVILAALAELTAQYMRSGRKPKTNG